MRKALLCGLLLVLSAAVEAADVKELTKQLKDADPEKRRAAAKELAEAGKEAKSAVPDLTKALKDKDRYVRRFAAKALGEIGPDAKNAIPALVAALDDDSTEVVEAAEASLEKFGSAAVPQLAVLLTDKKKPVSLRKKVIEMLVMQGKEAKPALTALAGLLKDKELRGDALTALGTLGVGDKGAIAAVTTATKDPDKAFAQRAADVLKKLQPAK